MHVRFSTVVGMALVLTAQIVVRASAAWTEYRSADGRFAILFPGEPQLDSSATTTDLGQVEIHTARCITGDRMCVVTYYDAPSVSDATREKFLDDNCAGFLQGSNLLQKGERKSIALGPHAGREVVGETQDGRAQLTARYFVVGERVYLVMIGTSVDDASSPDVAKYLASFRLLETSGLHEPVGNRSP